MTDLNSLTSIRMDRRSKKPLGTMSKTKIYMGLEEIMREYGLRHLPAKALHRSLAVCKDWKRQISSPFFIHNQSITFSSISGFFVQSPGKPLSFISHDQMAYGVPDQELKFLPEPVDLKATSNGLLCCRGRTGDKPYYVCNPVNQQWKKLPKPNANHGSDPAIALEFEPSLLNFLAEYKVLCVFPSIDIEGAFEFEIYSSVQDSWKVSSEMFFSSTWLHCTRGTIVNGVAYWHITTGKILIFDLKKEKASEMYAHGACGYGAPRTRQSYSYSYLGFMHGQLCISWMSNLSIGVYTLPYPANTMPGSFKIWPQMYRAQLNTADIQVGGINRLQVLLPWDNLIVLQAGGKIFIHDTRTRTTTLCSDSHIDSVYQVEVFPYVNSLVSLV